MPRPMTLRRSPDPAYTPGRNAEQIRAGASRVIRGPMPRQVRAELMEAVRAGYLGRLPKDGLRPEVFFHPDHRTGALDRQAREAAYSIGCVAAVMAEIPVEDRIAAALATLQPAP